MSEPTVTTRPTPSGPSWILRETDHGPAGRHVLEAQAGAGVIVAAAWTHPDPRGVFQAPWTVYVMSDPARLAGVEVKDSPAISVPTREQAEATLGILAGLYVIASARLNDMRPGGVSNGICAECGQPVRYAPEFTAEYHTTTGVPWCYRNPDADEKADRVRVGNPPKWHPAGGDGSTLFDGTRTWIYFDGSWRLGDDGGARLAQTLNAIQNNRPGL